MTTQDQLRRWAEKNRRNALAPLVTEMADAMESLELSTRWSLIDVRSEVEVRKSDGGTVALARLAAVISYLVPVGFAWYHLFQVFGAYRNALRLAGPGVDISFLAFWSGAYDGEAWAFDGTPARLVAAMVLGALVLVIALHMMTYVAERSRDRRLGQLDALVLAAQLHFASKRAVRPEEVTDVITIASSKLEKGLEGLRSAVDETVDLVQSIGTAAETLGTNSETLSEVSARLREAVAPLASFGDTVQSASVGISESLHQSASTLRTAENSLVEGLNQASGAVDRARGALDRTVSASETVSDGVRAALAKLGDAPESIRHVTDSFESAVTAISRAGEMLRQLGSSLESSTTSIEKVTASVGTTDVQTVLSALERYSDLVVKACVGLQDAVSHISAELKTFGEHVGRPGPGRR